MSGYSNYDVSKLEKKTTPYDYSCFYKEVLAISNELGGVEFSVVNEENASIDVLIDNSGTYIDGVSEIYDNVLAFISSDYSSFKQSFMKKVSKFDKSKKIISDIELAELTDESGKYDKPAKFKISDAGVTYDVYVAKDKTQNEGVYKINGESVSFYEFSSFLRKHYVNFLTQKKKIIRGLRNVGTSVYGENSVTTKRKSPASKYAVGEGKNVIFDVNAFLKDSAYKKEKREKNKPNSRAYRISKSILRRLNP